MRCLLTALVLIAACCWAPPTASAQLTSPTVGWQAELSKLFHNVSGTVTVLDENTVQVDDFTYDGGGIDVYFYLGKENTRNSFINGLEIGPQLLGTVYNGMQPPLVIDLPVGKTLEGWNAISVWCVTAAANFGSGTFGPASAPLEGDFNVDGVVDTADYVHWRNGTSGAISQGDYAQWRANFGRGSGTAGVAGAWLVSVPEPTAVLLMAFAALPPVMRRGVR